MAHSKHPGTQLFLQGDMFVEAAYLFPKRGLSEISTSVDEKLTYLVGGLVRDFEY